MSVNLYKPEEIPVVILAAGAGTRMREGGVQTPKALLPIRDVPLIGLQAAAFYMEGFRKFHIVDNQAEESLIEDAFAAGVRLADAKLKARARKSINEPPDKLKPPSAAALMQHAQYPPAGHVDALMKALDFCKFTTPFFVALGDIYFVAKPAGLRKMLKIMEKTSAVSVIASRYEKSMRAVRENFCIEANDEGDVVRVAEKPAKPKTAIKGVGIYLFDPSVAQFCKDRRPEGMTDLLAELLKRNKPVMHDEAVTIDVNVNSPIDYWRANLLSASGSYTASDAAVSPESKIYQSVVMQEAQVEGAGELIRSVVMPYSRAPLNGGRIINSLVAPGGIINFPNEDPFG